MPDPALRPYVVEWELHSPFWSRYGLTMTIEAPSPQSAEAAAKVRAEHVEVPRLVAENHDHCPPPYIVRVVEVRRQRNEMADAFLRDMVMGDPERGER